MSAVIPAAPGLVFDRADGEARAVSIAAVKGWLDAPDTLERVRGPLPPLNIADLDVPDRLKRRLRRAEENGFVLPGSGWIQDDLEPQFGYHNPSRRPELAAKTRGSDGAGAAGVIAASFALVVGTLGAAVFVGGPVQAVLMTVALCAGGLGAMGLSVADRSELGQDLRYFRYGLTDKERFTLGFAMQVDEWEKRSHEECFQRGEREAVLVEIATVLAGSIRRSPVWASGFLARTAFDADRELVEIEAFADQLRAVGDRLTVEPHGDTVEAQRAREKHAVRVADLDAVFETLVTRVAALHHYAAVLDELSEKVRALRAIESIDAAGSEIDALAVQLGANELATDRLDRLIDDAHGLRAEIEFLTGALAAVTTD